jgi:hypothetical protein
MNLYVLILNIYTYLLCSCKLILLNSCNCLEKSFILSAFARLAFSSSVFKSGLIYIYVFMCIYLCNLYIYVHIYTCIHMCIYTCIYIYMHIHTSKNQHIHKYTCGYNYIHKCDYLPGLICGTISTYSFGFICLYCPNV